MASFQSQYGIRLYTDLDGMQWNEFSSLLAGIDHRSPLGNIVAIRAEDNPEVLKEFTPDHRKIRSEWRNRMAKQMPESKVEEFIESMKQVFMNM